jgi:hypothetical protein
MGVAEEMEQRIAAKRAAGADTIDTEGANQLMLAALKGELFKQSPKTEGILGIDANQINGVVMKAGELIHDVTGLVGVITYGGLHVVGTFGSVHVDLVMSPIK